MDTSGQTIWLRRRVVIFHVGVFERQKAFLSGGKAARKDPLRRLKNNQVPPNKFCRYKREKISTSALIEEVMNEAKFEILSGLAKMESKDIALLFYETGFDTFYTALSGCNAPLRIDILKNVSHRTREIMQEELQLRSRPDWVFIEQALEEIAVRALALAARGLIQIPKACLETERLKTLIEERDRVVRSETVLAKLDHVSAAVNVLLNNSNQNPGS